MDYYCNSCNSCSKCGQNCGGACGKGCGKPDCTCPILSWMPHTKGTLVWKDNKCNSSIDLCPAVTNCQTVTHMDWNNQTGCIEFQNEKYISSDGAEGSLERVCVSDFLPFIGLNDLNDVEFDDSLAGNCYELIYHKDISCGDGCKSKNDHWSNFNTNTPGAKTFSMDYLRGATEDGCPVYLDKPDNCSLLMFSPSCTAPSGEWQPYKIPEAGNCTMEPDADGYYHVLKRDDCGCPVECKMPIMPGGMAALNYQRDSVPDDPDFPWYYGNYNDKINLHLAENAPRYFGKYDLKVTVNYGVQAIKSDNVPNYNWRSLVVPVAEGESVQTAKAASILQTSCIYTPASSTNIPWGSTALRGSFSFIVPKGKEAFLHHELRIRTNASFPNYYTGSWDGKRVPDAEATLNHVLHPATRLNALQVLIEPTQGSTDYDPVADAYREQLDAPIDSYPQSF